MNVLPIEKILESPQISNYLAFFEERTLGFLVAQS